MLGVWFQGEEKELRAERAVEILVVHSAMYCRGLVIRIGFWGPLYYNYNKEP